MRFLVLLQLFCSVTDAGVLRPRRSLQPTSADTSTSFSSIPSPSTTERPVLTSTSPSKSINLNLLPRQTAGPCADGASPTSTITGANGASYGICANTDFPQGFFRAIPGISTADECVLACSAVQGCVAATFIRVSQVCALKSFQGSAISNSNDDGIYEISGAQDATTTSLSSSCSCSSITTVTRTIVSSSTTTTSQTSNPSLCPGFIYQGYYSPFYIGTGDTSNYESFNATYFNSAYNSSLVSKWGGDSPDNIAFYVEDPQDPGPIYEQTYERLNFTAILYLGFFVPPISGLYSFYYPPGGIDDVGYAWLGPMDTDSIFTTFTEENCDIRAGRSSGANPSNSITIDATADSIYPFVLLWGNGPGSGNMSLAVQLPDGTTQPDTTGLFIHSCIGAFTNESP